MPVDAGAVPELGTELTPGSQAGVRHAKLRLSRVDPTSIFRLSAVFSLCIFVVVIVAVAALWFMLKQLGVFDSIVSAAQTLTDKTDSGIRGWLSFQRVMLLALLVGVVNIALMTVLSTLGALLYNLCSDLIGGVEVTLTEGDQRGAVTSVTRRDL